MLGEVKLPKMGSNMEEGTLIKWVKQIGDPVNKGDVLMEVETDKATLEVDAPASGYVVDHLYREGDVVPVGEVVCHISDDRAAAPARIRLSPAARRLARELNLTDEELRRIKGSGPRGRIVLQDLKTAAEQPLSAVQEQPLSVLPEQPLPAAQEQPLSAVPEQSAVVAGNEIPLGRLRVITARRMTESFRDVPQFQIKRTVDVSNLLRIRQTLNASIRHSAGIKLSVTDFLIQAAAQALVRHPLVNAYYGENNGKPVVTAYSEVNIGLAVALDEGLMVPVIRRADQMSLITIAQRRVELMNKAKANRLAYEDMSGGTFTISNLGSYDVDEFTAIVNTPESGILAVGAIKRQPVANSLDEVEIKPVITLNASFDHRTMDGADAARFMKELAGILASDKWKII